jgi:hypothetical protein
MEVDCLDSLKPCQIKYNHRLLRVITLLECWHDTGCWWEGESEKVFYRLALEDCSIREIFYDLAEKQWYLYKTYD